MKKKCYPAIFLFLSAAAGIGADSLWDLAVLSYTRGQNLNPGTMIIESSELDNRGRVKEFWEMEYALKQDSRGEETRELLWARKNGEPVSEKELKDREKGRGSSSENDGYFNGVQILPLDSSVRENVRVTATGKSETISGQDCRVYEYTQVYSGGAEAEGKVWITPQGLPVRIKMEFINLPFYVKNMENEINFSALGDTAVPGEMRMEGTISLVVYKIRFISTILFKNYLRP